MEYRQKLCQLEPSLNLTNKKEKTYRITYQLPSGKWHWHDNCCIWQTWYICKCCAEMSRIVRIQDKSTDTVYGTELAILNLFSNRITDRNALRHGDG